MNTQYSLHCVSRLNAFSQKTTTTTNVQAHELFIGTEIFYQVRSAMQFRSFITIVSTLIELI